MEEANQSAGTGADAATRVGPVTKDEIKQAFSKGRVSLQTAFWAAGMPEPQPLVAIRELRWMMGKRSGQTMLLL